MTPVSRLFRRGGAAHTACVVLALLAVLVLAAAGTFRVLCVGTDGHVGVEPASSDCCGVSDTGTDEDCGTCVDLVVESDAGRVERGPAVDPFAAVAVLAVLAEPLPLDVGALSSACLRADPDVPRCAAPAPRTAVLRC